MKTIVCIAGPTASGKTDLAQNLAGSFPFSLISVDSMQVYRGMDIGTGKPEARWRPFWALLDVADPGQGFSAGDFRSQARASAEQAWKENKIPLLAGGTGLYFKALLEGLADIPLVPSEVRLTLASRLKAEGLAVLVDELTQVDPQSAEKMDLKNPRRVQRALEVYRASGRPLSFWQAQKGDPLPAVQVVWIGLDPGKEELNRRISARTVRMFESGWLDEAAALEKRHGRQAVLKTGALGYAQIYQMLDGLLTRERALENIRALTRQYARRQMTWFKKVDFIHWENPGSGMESIKMRLEKALALSYNGRH